MPSFKQIAISGSNAYFKQLYISNVATSAAANGVLVTNLLTNEVFVTGSYADAGSPVPFDGNISNNVILESSDNVDRAVIIGNGATSNISSSVNFNSANGGAGLKFIKNPGSDGKSEIIHYGNGNFEIRLVESDSDFRVTNSNSQEIFRVNNNGRVFAPSLRQGLSSTYRLFYIPSTGEISYAVANSTKKIKENIKDLDLNLLKNFNQLRPVSFNYIADPDKSIIGGFIAEETELITPLLTKYGPNHIDEKGNLYKNPIDNQQVPVDVSDRALLALIVAKIQELDKKIEELKKLKQNGSI